MNLSDVVAANEGVIRLGFFSVTLIGMIGWEFAAPRRSRDPNRSVRWVGNFGMLLINTLVVRLVFPAAAVAAGVLAAQRDWGVFNRWHTETWLSVVICVVALDAMIYLQHRMLHALPVFWRFHRMHHADIEIDVSTGVRFHPVEIVFSLLIKCGAIVALGAPVLAVVIFEVLLSTTALFNHSNVRIAPVPDRLMRWLVVTPDMHRVHHSVIVAETNSNFGFNLTWWDRVLGTYRAQPRSSHEEMTLGLDTLRDPKRCQHLVGMLLIPFNSPTRDSAANEGDGK